MITDRELPDWRPSIETLIAELDAAAKMYAETHSWPGWPALMPSETLYGRAAAQIHIQHWSVVTLQAERDRLAAALKAHSG